MTEGNKMETLKCPSCGSSNLTQVSATEYKCAYCGTGFILTNVQKTGFVDVVLVQAGNNKTDVVKALRDITGKEAAIKLVDLRTALRFTETTPCVVVPNIPTDVGERVKSSLEKAGATVELKPA
jgi:large subunit ribosomal protein L7/L12